MPFKKGHKLGLGRKQSKETIEKRVSKLRGRKKKPHSIETRMKMSLSRKGIKPTPEQNKKMSEILKGRNITWGDKISKAKLGKPNLKLRGANCALWKGGITPMNMKIRSSLEYKIWRTAVFERDKYTCIWCGMKSGNGKHVQLNADHIKPFSLFPELRFAIDNGRTLCVDCHKKTDTFAGKINHPNLFQ